MKWPISNKIGAGFASALLILLVIAWISYQSTIKFVETNDQVLQIHQDIKQLDSLLSRLTEAEAGRRGYIITGDESFLEKYQAAAATVGQELGALRELHTQVPDQSRILDTLHLLVRDRLSQLQSSIEWRRKNGLDLATQRGLTHQGRKASEEIRNLIQTMKNAETSLLNQRMQQAKKTARVTIATITFGSFLAFGLVTLAGIFLRRDMVRRRRAEDSLRRLTTILEATTDFVATADTEGRVLYFNKAARKFLELSQDEDISGIHISDVHPAWAYSLVKDQGIPTAIREGAWSGETALLNRSGREIPVSQVIIVHTAPSGELQFLSTIARDTTERNQREETLKENERRVRELCESLPQFVWTCLPEGPCDYLSRQWVEYTGIPEANQLGFGWLQQLHPEDRERTVAAWKAAVKNGTGFDVEFRIRRADGVYRWFKTRATRLSDASGKTMKWFGSNTDIDDQKRAEEEIKKLNEDLNRRAVELESANKELEAFSYSVSHDLRAPLRHIDGFVHLIQKHAASSLDEKSRRYLKTLSESAKQMGHLIDDLLAFSRMGRSELRRTAVRLDQLVQEVVREFQEETQRRKIHWKIGPLPQVDGDPSMLRLALLNLVSNAVKYTRPRTQPRIEISSNPEGDETVFFIRDNGVGFDMQYVNKLFGVFQRLHSAAEFEGTGIGLANVRRIVHRHGGRIWAEGAVEGGATFYFSLPNRKAGEL